MQQKLLELFKGSVSCYMQADAITEIALKLSLRSPMFAQCLLKQHGELCKLLERYAKENPTLPICASKIRIFKEGQMRWNEIKPSFLNKSKLDWITNYTRSRMNRLTTHLKRPLKEQARIARLCAVNDLHFPSYGEQLSGQSSDAEPAPQL